MASLNFCCRTIVPCVALILNCCCLNLVDYGCMCQCVECMSWNTRMLGVVRVPAELEEQVKLCISWFCWAWRLAKNWPEKQPSEDNCKLSGCCSRSSGTCSWTQDVRVEITECIYGQEPVRKSPRNANLWFSHCGWRIYFYHFSLRGHRLYIFVDPYQNLVIYAWVLTRGNRTLTYLYICLDMASVTL